MKETQEGVVRMHGGLQRFVAAQGDVYATVRAELQRGRKDTHWMWYIFPQLRGLGYSETAQYYGIADLDEARAYLLHPVLGARLTECCRLLLAHKERTAEEIFGAVDAMKLRSSMTLFSLADDKNTVFRAVLDAFFDGVADAKTLQLLRLEEKV